MSDFEDFEDENAEEKLEEALKSPDLSIRAEAIETKARKCYEKGNSSEAIILMESAAELRESNKDFVSAAQARMNLGWLHGANKHYAKALQAYQFALKDAREGFNSELEIDALFSCGNMERRLRNYDEALGCYLSAVHLADESDYRNAGYIKTQLARLLRKMGRDEEAQQYAGDAAVEFEKYGFEWMVATSDNELANAMLHAGDLNMSFEKAKEAYHLADYNDNTREMDKAQFLMARAKNKMGQFAEAHKIIEEMKARPDFGKRIKHKVRTDLELATALAGMGRGEEAMKLLNKVVPVLKQKDLKVEVAEALAAQARMYFFVPNMLDCEQTAAEALKRAESLGVKSLVIEMTYLLAACYEIMERLGDREALLQKITSDPFNEKHQEYWFSASELALHFAVAGNAEAAQSYVDLIKASKSPFVNDAVQAQSLEAQAILLDAAGEKVKAKNARAKAMQTYLIAGNPDRATALAKFLKEN